MGSLSSRWIDLAGTANTRDLGGLPVTGGGRIRPHVLLRSDNLQDLTSGDVTRLVDEIGLGTVLDLRTSSERASEGPPPLAAVERVRDVHLPLIPDSRDLQAEPGAVLPDRWADGAVGAYLHYLNDAPKAIAEAVRILADDASGAAIAHCAAGKDRTGMLVAIVLATVGVERASITADYLLTNDRIEAIFARLAKDTTYAVDVQRIGLAAHRVSEDTMDGVLDIVDERWGSPTGYLRAAGVTDEELAQLRARLVAAG